MRKSQKIRLEEMRLIEAQINDVQTKISGASKVGCTDEKLKYLESIHRNIGKALEIINA